MEIGQFVKADAEGRWYYNIDQPSTSSCMAGEVCGISAISMGDSAFRREVDGEGETCHPREERNRRGSVYENRTAEKNDCSTEGTYKLQSIPLSSRSRKHHLPTRMKVDKVDWRREVFERLDHFWSYPQWIFGCRS